jgi:3D (Asp-Asp-Asp) domain-containing protein
MSVQRIREWMHNNPDGANTVRRQNRQVVFLRIVGLNDATEAIGAQGIPLTAGRSIAVDKALHAYGTPFFIEADLPLPGTPSQSPFRRLMIAQDTGSAIVGPARADLFFGAGEEAGKLAGRIQQSGRFAMLVPRELGLSVMKASIPLPPAKPAPSLASYAFRPAASRAKSELALAADSFHPATLHPLVPPQARPAPSQVAARSFRPAVPMAARPELPQVAARALLPRSTLSQRRRRSPSRRRQRASHPGSLLTCCVPRSRRLRQSQGHRRSPPARRSTLSRRRQQGMSHRSSRLAQSVLPNSRLRQGQGGRRSLLAHSSPWRRYLRQSLSPQRPAFVFSAPPRWRLQDPGLSQVSARARQPAANLGAQVAPRARFASNCIGDLEK